MHSQEGKPQDTTQRPENSPQQNQQPNGQKTALDFLRQKTSPKLQGAIDPAAIARQVKEQMEASKQDPSATPSAAPDKPIEEIVKELPHVEKSETPEPSPTMDTAGAERVSEDTATGEDGEEDLSNEETDIEELVDPSLTAENKPTLRDSYKTLKAKYKETNDALKKERDEREKWQKKSEAYETGTAIPKVLQEKEDELQKLKHYKDLVDFKSSEEYDQKFAKPLEESKTRLKKLSDELNVPLDAVLEAAKGSEGQFNQFLSDNFDIVSAMEVKTIVKGMNEIESKRAEAESSPQKHMERLRAETARANEVREAERKHSIQSASKQAWVNTLNKIKAEGKYTALIYSDTDKDFNERVVKPLMTAAATEYGKTIQMLAERGIKDLDPKLAEAIALGHLYGTSSGVLAQAATQAMEEAEKIKTNTKNLFKFNRPSLGGTAPNGVTPSAAEKPAPNPLAAAKQITQKILAQRSS